MAAKTSRFSVGAALFLLLGSQATAGNAAQAEYETGWIPTDQIFPTISAASGEGQAYIAFTDFDPNDGESFLAALVSLGASYPIYRWRMPNGGYWQLDLFGAAASQFNMDAPSDALLNTDYFIGFPLAWRQGSWSARLRLFHQSSHFGDELLLSGEAPPRINLSYEALDATLAYEFGGWRIYGGGTYLFSKDTQYLGDVAVRGGVEYLSQAPIWLGGRLWSALDLLGADFLDAGLQTKLLTGLRWGRATPGHGSITLALQAFTGPVPFGQFFDDYANYYGVVVYFTLD